MTEQETKTEVTPHYPVQIVGRHVEVTEAMKTYAEEKLSKINRFNCRIIDVVVTMDIQKLEHRVDIVVKIENTLTKVHASTNDMYASIDLAVGKLVRLLRRYHQRLHEHHAKGLSVVDMNVNLIQLPVDELEDINEDIEAESLNELEVMYKPHEIVEKKTRPLKTLSDDEAIMKMELSMDKFMIFRHEADQKLRVIYRRGDENYGIIEPE